MSGTLLHFFSTEDLTPVDYIELYVRPPRGPNSILIQWRGFMGRIRVIIEVLGIE